jgi:membrane associated rhomboid family serine protease
MIPYRTTAPAALMPVATLLVIAANVALTLYVETLPERQALAVIYGYGLVPAFLNEPGLAVANGIASAGLATLLTNTFLHGGFVHLIFNMWALWLFGGPIEGRLGAIRFLALYLLCGLAGSAGHLLFNMDSTVPAVGASGAIAGVMGGFMLTYPHSRVALIWPIFIFPLFFQVPALVFTGLWFVIQLTSGWTDLLRGSITGDAGGIAWWAHVAGFVAGALLIKPLDPWLPPPPGGPWTRGPWTRGPWTRGPATRGPWG